MSDTAISSSLPNPHLAFENARRWSTDQVAAIYHKPLFDLIEQAHGVHSGLHPEGEVQLCNLLSIKTGGCPEDCSYCPQSARYSTGVEAGKLLPNDEVLAAARLARDAGSTRFCMGAAWRQVKDGPDFDRVLELVRGVADLGLEVCCTLGMLSPQQAQRLAEAGLTAYNHNLDTSANFYGHIISTRTYEDRLRTIENVRQAGITVCCGGILGLGETEDDRIGLLSTLANLNPPPESVPINALVAVPGTPLEDQPPVDTFEFVRAIATARILMPRSKVRLSAGRLSLSPEAQALCFYAGANSIFVGNKLLTTPNPAVDEDHALLEVLGLKPEASHLQAARDEASPCRPAEEAGQGTRARIEAAWGEELDRLAAIDRRRGLAEAQPQRDDFCSNDYLGLAREPRIREAMERALRDGVAVGSTGSRLVSGNHPAIERLESSFADWHGSQAALLYSSGYAAGVGVLTALVRRQDIVFSDALNHASLIDGMRLAGAERVLVPHLPLAGSLEALRLALRRHPAASGQRRYLVLESLYSMEGDVAPLTEVAELCREAGVALVVDEAHATGVCGADGAGWTAHRPELADVLVATLHPCGKALGASGCLVAGSRRLREYLINRSRSFIFSTAPSPLLAVQLSAAIEIARAEPERREQVAALAHDLRLALAAEGIVAAGEPSSPIVPVRLGADAVALQAAASLTVAGFAVRAIRPPTVPEGSARLRLTVHAQQTSAAGRRLARQLAGVMAPDPAGSPGEATLTAASVQ